jgi:hypothetical protein
LEPFGSAKYFKEGEDLHMAILFLQRNGWDITTQQGKQTIFQKKGKKTQMDPHIMIQTEAHWNALTRSNVITTRINYTYLTLKLTKRGSERLRLNLGTGYYTSYTDTQERGLDRTLRWMKVFAAVEEIWRYE